MTMIISDKHKAEFIRLAGELSPENLCCDGELSPAETRKKLARLKREWVALEARCGYRVSEDMVWRWHRKRGT